MSEHTPGPWFVVGPEHGGAGYGEVCEVFGDGPNDIIIGCPEGGDFSAEADARLIAAAPDMYEALKEIEKAEGAFSQDPLTHAGNCIEAMQGIARAALAKAEEA